MDDDNISKEIANLEKHASIMDSGASMIRISHENCDDYSSIINQATERSVVIYFQSRSRERLDIARMIEVCGASLKSEIDSIKTDRIIHIDNLIDSINSASLSSNKQDYFPLSSREAYWYDIDERNSETRKIELDNELDLFFNRYDNLAVNGVNNHLDLKDASDKMKDIMSWYSREYKWFDLKRKFEINISERARMSKDVEYKLMF